MNFEDRIEIIGKWVRVVQPVDSNGVLGHPYVRWDAGGSIDTAAVLIDELQHANVIAAQWIADIGKPAAEGLK